MELSSQRLIQWYAFTIFMSSATVMILEIVAARIIAPYLGVSLYTWTSIIGVVLAGLSLGNWMGGVWADRGANKIEVGIVLVLSGITTLSVLLLLTWMAPLVLSNSTNLLNASLLLVGSLFFVPALLMGIVMPLLMTLALSMDSHTGHVVGKLEAMAALGSILGTFIAGYWLIQYFGTRLVIVTIAIILFFLALPYLWRGRVMVQVYLLLATLLIVGLTYWRDGFTNPCDKESQYYCIRVVDMSDEVPFGTAKGMVLDHLLHSINYKQGASILLAPYVQLMDEMVDQHFNGQRDQLRYFFAGGGAYTQPRAIQAMWPAANVDVAEIDPVVTDFAEKHLWFRKEGVNIYHKDARVILSSMPVKSYDVIVGDVFQDITIPFHLVTLEYMTLIKERLTDKGIYLMNLVDRHPDPLLLKSIYRTIKQQFKSVQIYLDGFPDRPARQTYVIIAGDQLHLPDVINSKRGEERSWQKVTAAIVNNGTQINTLPVLTDDYAPVDRLISELLLKGL